MKGDSPHVKKEAGTPTNQPTGKEARRKQEARAAPAAVGGHRDRGAVESGTVEVGSQ